MYSLPKAEFYITNVCNLNCTNCNKFNNFAFAGHELWSEHQQHYKAWSKILDFTERIAIMGGEPMLNPEFMSWVQGLSELWPRTPLNIATNGSQLLRWPDLYSVILDRKDQILIRVTIHGQLVKQDTIEKIEKFLQGPIEKHYDRKNFPDHEWQRTWEIVKAPDWPDCANADDFKLLPEYIRHECETQHSLGPQLWTDTNGVRVLVSFTDNFVNSAIIPDYEQQTFGLHNSDPQKAVDICFSKHCHLFSQGRLFKCGVVGILPDFYRQFNMNISDSDRDLIYSYHPAEPDWSKDQMEIFLANLKKGEAIAQCKFCPEKFEFTRFNAGTKKIKFVKNPNK